MAEPTGIICMIMSGSCPAGWTQYNTINDDGTGIYLRAATTPNVVPAGDNTHNHSGLVNHTHTGVTPTSSSYSDTSGTGWNKTSMYPDNCYYPPHSHGAQSYTSGNNSAANVSVANHAPLRASFILCRKT